MILDARAIAATTGAELDVRAYLLACYPDVEIPPLEHVVATADPMTAEVNHGIWIAPCDCGARGLPAPGCVVDLLVPLGFCIRCRNRGRGGGWRPIIVPDPIRRRVIAAVLECRPDVGDRNWQPPETLADLVRQNLEHGDPVPELALGPILGPMLGPRLEETITPFSSAAALRAALARSVPRRRLRRLLGI